jgi:sugar lactone lactonase YvrE
MMARAASAQPAALGEGRTHVGRSQRLAVVTRVNAMARGRAFAVGRRALAAVMVLAVIGCGSSGSASNQNAQSFAPTHGASAAASSPSQTASTAPMPAGPSPIVAQSMAIEPALATLWETAGPTAERGSTWTPAVDPSGRIWAASSFSNVFWIFDRKGKYQESWGTPGNGEGQFELNAQGAGAGAVTFRPDGGFYVADSGNSRIQQFDKNRNFIKAWGSFGTGDDQFTYPVGIGTDGEGNVYSLDAAQSSIHEFDAHGMFIRTVAENVGPYMAIARDGSVVTFDNTANVLERLAPDGSRTLAVDISQVATFATDIAVTTSGEIFVASSTSGGSAPHDEHLIELDATGKLLHVWPNGGEGIALAPAGDRMYMTLDDRVVVVRAVALP